MHEGSATWRALTQGPLCTRNVRALLPNHFVVSTMAVTHYGLKADSGDRERGQVAGRRERAGPEAPDCECTQKCTVDCRQ